ncbi:MAG: ATP-binding cassette domain-containing protein [Syntrophobacteraceae bacterium]|nr:ATP-binding cassette domain-containing protein [Syntrophobacteraceae bacterium]
MVDGFCKPAPQGESPVVRLRALTKTYGREPAVCGVDMDIYPGEIFGLIGPDGAGKSSIMKAIAGVMTFDGGTLNVFETRIDSEKSAERIKDRIGFMPQGLGQNLYPDLSVDENIDFFARSRLVSPKEAEKRKRLLLEMTRLAPFSSRPMKNLSGGMKQKLGLVCTLIHEPGLVILDEPTTGLDPVSRRDFWTILSVLLREKNITALVSTAYMDEASRFHRLSLFYGGRVLAHGSPEEIMAAVPGALVSFRTERQSEALSGLKARFSDVQARGSWLRVFVKGAGEKDAARQVQEAAAAAGEDIVELRAGAAELEDIFIALLREKKLTEESSHSVFTLSESDSIYREEPGDDGADIEAENLVKDFGNFRAVDGVSFRVEKGEIFGLLGANGAGKSTVIKMLVGLLPPSAGTGYVAGHGMLQAPRAIRERIGYMSQVFSLYRDLTVIENISLYAGIYGLDRRQSRERAGWILEMAELAGHENRQTEGLPMGVRQRLALGCALVHSPRILFLDEPTSGVDPLGRRRFWDILFRLSRRERVTILITTHYMSEAEHCDHLALMYGGKVIADASPGAMKRELATEAGELLEVDADDPLPAMSGLQEAGFEGVSIHGRQIRLLTRDREAAERRIREVLAERGTRIVAISEQPLSMEDVFVYRVMAMERNGRQRP